MSLHSITEQWTGSSAGEGTATRSFLVQTTDPRDGPVFARQAAGIPRLFDQHPKDPWLRCVASEVTEVKGPCSFLVTSRYESKGGENDPDHNPLNEPAKIRCGFVISQEPEDMDLDGKPLVNTVGEPFDPPLTREVCDPCVTITRNEPGRPSWDINDTVNTDTVLGAKPGELRLRFESERIIQGEFIYWTTTYTVIRRAITPQNPTPWRRRVINQGFRYLYQSGVNGGADVYEHFRSAAGAILSAQQNLTADGMPLPSGERPVWLSFKDYREIPFAPLRLPGG